MSTIKPLSNSQKLFLQRLLVSHILTDNEARDLYNSIRDKFANVQNEDDDEDNLDPSYMGNSFDHNLGLINASLLDGFNMEICTVLAPPPYDPDTTSNKKQSFIKYHALVNKSNDAHAKSHAASMHYYGPHEHAYLRLLLEKLVEKGNEMEGITRGCAGVMNKMDVLNSRTDLEGAHEGKLSIPQTEAALETFVNEKWLVEMAPPGEEDDDEEDEEEDRPKKKKRKSADGRRKSLRGTYYGIGPRCFLELGEFLRGVGMEEDKMPQTLLNRV